MSSVQHRRKNIHFCALYTKVQSYRHSAWLRISEAHDVIDWYVPACCAMTPLFVAVDRSSGATSEKKRNDAVTQKYLGPDV
jgi:hypothetical protein